MKSTILCFAFLLTSVVGATQAQAQCTYTSKPGGGKWSDPNTWVISGKSDGNLTPTNSRQRNGQDASNNIIVINSAVELDTDYSITGDHAKMVITSTGSLTDQANAHNLYFGEQTGPDMTRLQLDGTLDVYSVSFYKADAQLSATANLSTDCNISLANQSDLMVAPGAEIDIDGNLMVTQGNPRIMGTGTLSISGCVLTQGNGGLNGLFAPGLRVCVQGQPNDCATDGMSCNPRVQEYITVNACASAPLPVELASFNARYTNKQVQLQWVTASEKNSANFAVERSADGKTFEVVTTVRAAGNSSVRREYSAVDNNVRPGLNYYRLKQTDLDGTSTTSQVVAVQAGAAEQQLSAYGTPGNLIVEMRTDAVCRAIRVMDSMGRVLHTEVMPDGATGLVTRQIPLRQSLGGVYIVQAVTTNGTLTKKTMLRD
ncbi:hypothetical protein D3Y59_00985 [Hymenobacter oligotrophus]|uniref:T9SS C-terminal target domain-containing protein n=1 Tax=Hymenobacter oligotrophus TaxID=2319843 RepID=A0A3B7QWQ4_9BACT|nr:hypothetical protein [Hymenobacter oligotrophus]AYA35752.1 hypothetical protein D3Y59_00985 [Hymenobacter oligotrophus]